MLLEMALNTLTVIGSLLVLQTAPNSGDDSSRYLGDGQECSNDAVSNIWSTMPPCRPRDTMVALPLPEDADVVEVIPSHVMVPRCDGVCHQGNLYHHCVPKADGRTTTNFEVLLY